MSSIVAVFQALANDPFFNETFTIFLISGSMSGKPSLMNFMGRLSISHDFVAIKQICYLTSSLVNSLKQSNVGTVS